MKEGFFKIINSKSKTFLTFCFCFLLGVAFSSFGDKKLDFVYLYFIGFVAVSFVLIFKKSRSVLFFVLCCLLFTLGFFRYNFAIINNVDTGKQEFIAYVSAEPDVRQGGVRYILKTNQVRGKIYLSTELYPRYKYGDELKINCRLEKPDPIEDFRYDMYLARFGVFSVCRSAKVEKVGKEKGIFLFSKILNVKEVVAERVNLLWHEPYAGFMAGLLYGYRGGLGSLNEHFSRTGVTHIIAISGYNITIVVSILMTLCIHLYIPRKKAFWLIVLGIVVFVVFAGLSGSVVRAGIMGILVLVAKQAGRLSGVGNVMVFTAVLMTLHNPFVLMWDAGFQLSFLSTIGLVYLAPIIEKPLRNFPEWFGIKESFVSTMAAILITLPLILFQFGRLSIVAPLTNMLILWIIPWLMFVGFGAVILSYVFLPLGKLFAWLGWFGMEYVVRVVKYLSGVRFASLNISFHWLFAIVLYFVLFLFIRFFHFRD